MSAYLVEQLIQVAYIFATALFILALKWLAAPATARRGVLAGEVGMLLAVVGTLLHHEIVSYQWILVGFVLGSAIGAPMALYMPMTAVPQRTALSHAFGALAAALVGTAEYYLHTPQLSRFTMVALALELLLGSLTFTGSLMAFGKLQELLPTRPVTYRGQNVVNLSLLALAVASGIYLVVEPGASHLFPVFVTLGLLFGVLLIIPIGGADMPTVISLLNSYAGLAASAMGFVLDNKLLIIAGALDGASGLIRSVIIVPGYGMAVAQAQHKVREIYDALTKRGVDVKFAIHPVAGRMPGHMNVLLAEADIPYDRLLDMDAINPEFAHADVALVIGANDVTNPAARHDRSSPIYGMPILDVDKARTVMVIKRSMSPGFAGIENELYYLDKAMMLFGDAKAVVGDIVKALSDGGHG